MAELKRNTTRRLRSARQWLIKAEQSFEKDREVRGELDLLLAKAELQHVQETKQATSWRYRYPLLRHGLAFGLAVFIAAAGVGSAAYWTMQERERAVPIPLAAQEKLPVAVKAEAAPVLSAQPEVNRVVSKEPVSQMQTKASAPVVPAMAPASEEEAATVRTVPPAREVRISQDEMQRLVREAGKSLRGQ